MNCDDGIGCTDDSCNESTDSCDNVTNDANCDNGLYCDGAEICDAALDCQPGTAVDCDDGIGCTDDSCNESTDACDNVTNDANCDNGLYCDGAEICDAALDCQAGTAVDCDDGIVCTDDSCNETTDSCDNVANDANCDNGLYCDGSETCDAALDCQAGTAPDCSDGIGCTDDSCNETTDSCDHVANDANCDDGQYCNGAETCDAALDCQAGTPPDCSVLNDDGVACTDDVCDPAANSGAGACVNNPNDANCDDGQFCNGAETCDALLGCQAGTDPCTNPGSPVCDETNDACVGCLGDGDCDDGQYCNGSEVCVDSVCQSGTAPNCDDGVPCTDDSCNETTDTCDNVANDANCDDGLFCNGAETCDALLGCQAGTAPDCDDGVACTDDACNETTDSCDHVANDANCDDGLYCNGAETCDALLGCQAGTAPDCDDGVACTDDSCNETTDSCDNIANDANCDDGAFCNGAETCDALLGCQAGTAPNCDDGVPCTDDSCNETTDTCDNLANDANCDDGAFCNGAETCDALLGCQAGTAPNCDDGIPCTDDSCNETTDTCDNVANDANCDDGLYCNGAETCDALLGCQAGTAPNCDDGVPCTDDSCNETTDACENVANDANCDDGLYCNGAETCDAVLGCQAGTAPNCDDGVPCTDDSCNETTDSCDNLANDANCDDGLFCNGAETCDALSGCQAGTAPNCDDGIPCTDDACNESTDTCDNLANDANCDDGLYCNGAETCDALSGCQSGTAPNCDDGVPCTDDSCNETTDTCDNIANDANCDDGLYCNGTETCDAVLNCQAGTAPNCDDGVTCTDDSCNETTDSCDNIANNANCDDGLYCNGAETCDVLLDCQAGTAPDCDDGVPCTDDSCNESTDSCDNIANDANCDDGLYCNGAETCDVLLDCQAGTAPDCDDGVPCTDDSCNETTDTCANLANDANCDDGLFCNGAETCDALLDCQAGTAPNCDDGVACTDDSCNETTDTCDNVANDGNCDDGLYCNGAETCDALLDCQAGTAPNCDDGVSCTDDSCNEVTDSCDNIVNDANCDDGLYCNGVETCDAALDCQAGTAPNCDDGVACTDDSCNETTDTCDNLANDVNCDDGLYCNGAETCDALLGCQAGTAPDCDDGVACTDDSCNETTDTCDNLTNDANCDDGVFCNGAETCDAVLGCQAGTAPDCNDGVACTLDDCYSVTDACRHIPVDEACDDAVFCNGVETCDVLLGCQPASADPCDDGVGCTIDTCDDVTDTCTNTPDDAACDDGQYCNGAETCDVLLDCQAGTNPCTDPGAPECDETNDICVACLVDADCDDGINCTDDSCDQGTGICNNIPNDAICDDGLHCNGAETCDVLLGCQAGTAPNCDDGVTCTEDSCNETTDACDNIANDANCDDGLYCNGVETCDAVLDCQAGTAPDCNDGVTCTDDSCNETTDTCDNIANDANCDDGQFCNGAETCDALLGCQAGSAPNCDDGVTCTDDSCNESTDTCDHVANDANCDDGLYCNGAETCDAALDCQAGTAPNCDDGVACTDDSCNEATDTCDNIANDVNCDDGLYCNGFETCDALLGCQAGTAPNCDDGVPCTDDSCNETTDSCDNIANDANCDDGAFCNGAETCDAALGCQAGTAPNCDDGVPCTDDSCNETTDSCDNIANDANCDDGAFCNGAETCDAVLGCQAGTAPNCDDGVPCTDDSCNETTDSCDNIANDANCDDGAFCNGAETCDAALGCQAGTAPNCDDGVPCTDDSCNESTDSCDNVANDANCDDGLYCNGAETCDAVLGCQAGTAPNCDDGVTCTDDSCNETTDSCDNIVNDANCDDGAFCNGAETCDAVLGCQAGTAPNCDDGVVCTDDSCNETTDSCDNLANDANCDNGLYCDGAEICDAVLGCQTGTAPNCDDGVACTDDSCNETTDSCDNLTNDANCDNGLYCDGAEICDAALGCQAGTAPNCDDGVTCTDDSCNETTDSCDNLANDANCDDGLYCNGTETCDAALDCQAGADPCASSNPNIICDESLDACVDTCTFDCNFNVAVDTGDYSYFLSCFGEYINPGDTCECADYNGNGAGDTGDYGGFLGCFGEYCPCSFGGPAPSRVETVDIRLVVSHSPVEPDYTDVLPASEEWIGSDELAYVHVYASRSHSGADGLACAYVDLHFDPRAVTVTGAEAATDYSMFPLAMVSQRGGAVRNVGGCIGVERLDTLVGYQWARIASAEVSSQVRSGAFVFRAATPSSPFAGISVVGSSVNVDASMVSFGAVKARVAPYDVGSSREIRRR